MNNLPFSEKYRLRKVSDLILDKIIATKIASIIKNKDIPNIIFTGKSGPKKYVKLFKINHILPWFIYKPRFQPNQKNLIFPIRFRKTYIIYCIARVIYPRIPRINHKIKCI